MKKIILLFVILFFVNQIMANQKISYIDSFPKSHKIYKAEVKGFNKNSLGYLTNINDTGVRLSTNPVFFGSEEGNAISYREIDLINIRRKGAVGRGIGYGIVGGVIVGAIVGAILYKPCTGLCFLDFGMGGNMAAGSLLGFIPGGIIGAVSGTKKARYEIKGNQANFYEMNKSVMLKIYPARK